MKYVHQFGTSNNELERKASIKVLGYICDSDSCLEYIKEDIDSITDFIVAKLQDPSVNWDQALCFSSLSEKLQLKLLESFQKT